MASAKKPSPARKIAKAARAVVTGLTVAGQLAMASAPVMEEDPTKFVVTQPAAEQPPPVLLAYQQRWIADEAQLKICEKSRRTGFTWAESADNVLIAAAEGGSNVFYISATQDMAREYIEACAMWARAFDYAASEISEGLYDDGEAADGSKRFIKTYEVVFPRSGKRIVALSSRPTNLRGKQGVIVIDEAAFHNDLAALIKAAMAMLLWGDKVRIISTHDGAENPFNQLIQEVRAGKRGTEAEASVHRVTFRQAVADGLYRRVCLRKGIDWTAEGEAKWVASAYRFYGDDAAEELDAVPSQSAGAYLSLTLIEQRMTSVPPPEGPIIIRGKWDDAFAYLPEDVRRHAINGWLQESVTPLLKLLHKDRLHAFGEDFARNRDQAVTCVLEQGVDLVQRCKIVLELQNCPFSSQQQILFHLVDNLPRFRGGAMDASGNGAALAEAAAQRYGTQMIEQVKASDGFYLQHMPKLRAGLQDGTLTDIPRDEALRDDLRSIKLINGIPKIPRVDTQSAAARAAAADGGNKTRRHGDFAIALFLAVYSFFREVGEIDYTPAPTKGSQFEGSSSDDDLMVTLLIGVGLLVAARAMRRAAVQAAARAEAQRDVALSRAELAERERELVRAELQLLRAQVEPHFLWNTLANVEYLIRSNPPQAQQMLGQLISYLRANVATGSRQQSTLGSEFDSVRAYLGLMQFRMGQRLQFEMDLPEAWCEVAFPPLILQTLVENAIKHGLEPKQGSALLRIAVSAPVDAPECLQVEVQDNGVGLQPSPRTRGTQLGLRNVRERLQALYGVSARLSIAGVDTGGVSARIEWPLNPELKS